MPEIDQSTLRPGFLIGLKTSVRGNVSYAKETIEPEHKTRSGAQKAKWQTERTIADPEEHKLASQARMKARQVISSVCAVSAFGLLCPESEMPKLELAVKEARRVVGIFNRKARLTTVGVYVISGRIARDDVEAARAIKSEVRDLLKQMKDGVENLDVEAVRAAANRARNIGSMLTPAAAGKIKGAIEAARGAARKIVKAGETAAVEIDRTAVAAITAARTAFLDVQEEAEEAAMGAPEVETRAIDLDPEAELPSEAPPEPETPSAPIPRRRSGETGRAPSEAPARTNKPKKGKRVKKPAVKKAAVATKRRRVAA